METVRGEELEEYTGAGGTYTVQHPVSLQQVLTHDLAHLDHNKHIAKQSKKNRKLSFQES